MNKTLLESNADSVELVYSVWFRRLFPWFTTTLFGDRLRYGKVPPPDDEDWLEWQKHYQELYEANQGAPISRIVNHAGYKVMELVDMSDRSVLEIGPGSLPHIQYWRNSPQTYTIADIKQEFLDSSSRCLAEFDISYESILLDQDSSCELPFPDETFDIIVSFYSLEHLPELSCSLTEIRRVLRSGGMLVGAIPTEGSLAWGVGRMLTTRRRLRKTYPNIDPEKYICWEHPNFSDEILNQLEANFLKKHVSFWPLGCWAGLDANLIVSFQFKKN